MTPPKAKGELAASSQKGILKNPPQNVAQVSSGSARPVTPPKAPAKLVGIAVKATAKSPPPKKDHAMGLESSSYTEVEEEEEGGDLESQTSEKRTPSKSRSRTPLVRRPKGQKQRAKFAKEAARRERSGDSPRVHFKEEKKDEQQRKNSKGAGSSGGGKDSPKGKGKSKKGKGKKGKGGGKGKGKKGHKSGGKGPGRGGGRK